MKKNQTHLTLGDLILAVSAQARGEAVKKARETVAAVADLLGSGRVRFPVGRRLLRGRVH